MAGMIEAHASIHIITDIFAVFKALIRFPRVILTVIVFITMVTSVPVTMIAAITLSATVSVTTAIPVSGLAMAGAVANVKANTTASAVVEKRRVDMIAAF